MTDFLRGRVEEGQEPDRTVSRVEPSGAGERQDPRGVRNQPASAPVPGKPEPTLVRRLGWMADAVVHAKTGPKGRFFSRERADEIALLLREAERFILEGR